MSEVKSRKNQQLQDEINERGLAHYKPSFILILDILYGIL